MKNGYTNGYVPQTIIDKARLVMKLTVSLFSISFVR